MDVLTAALGMVVLAWGCLDWRCEELCGKPWGALTCQSGARGDESAREPEGAPSENPLENLEAPDEAKAGQRAGDENSNKNVQAAGARVSE